MKKRFLLAAPVAATMILTPLPALAQPVTSVVINEVESNGDAIGDWVELANTDNENSIDISGWSLVDNDVAHDPQIIPDGTTIESGGYFVFYTDMDDEFGFGLGGNDSVTLFDASGDIVDFTEWSGHAETTWGRVPDMTGDFAATGEPTQGMINTAAGEQEPIFNAFLPYHNVEVKDVELGADFTVEDMSGADFDQQGRAWIVNNDAGDIYALDHDAATDTYTLAGHWQVTYPEGTGTPDGEGIAIAADGSIYLATERNNDASSTSRPSILRFDAPTSTSGLLTATDEWNLSEFTGTIGANSGLETIAQIDGTIFAVGVEGTGQVLVVDIAGSTATLVQDFQSAFQGVMALDYNADTRQLHVLCDEVCEGASQFLTWNGIDFTPADGNIYARPAALGNFANEGFASYTTEGECTDGAETTFTSYLWADDSVNGGISIRSAQVSDSVDCGDDKNSDGIGSSNNGSSNNSDGSSDFITGSIAGSFATGLLGVVGLLGVLGGLFQQVLSTFPSLNQYFRM